MGKIYFRNVEEEEALRLPIAAWNFMHRRNGIVLPCWHKGGHVILPTAKVAPRAPGFPLGKTWLFYGPPKGGKSTLAAQFPDALHIDAEDGTDDIGGYVVKPTSLDELGEIAHLLETPAGAKYKSVILDPLDAIHDWVERDSLKFLSKKLKAQYDVMGEVPNGLDWSDSRNANLGIIHKFRQIGRATGKNIIIVAHSQAVMTEKGTVEQKAMTIDLPGKLGRRIPANVDIIGYCYGQKRMVGTKAVIDRMISFQPYEGLEAGCRFKELNGKVIPMSFQAIKDCFVKK